MKLNTEELLLIPIINDKRNWRCYKEIKPSQVLDILSSTGTLNSRVLSHWNKGQVHNLTRLEFSKAQVRVTIELKLYIY